MDLSFSNLCSWRFLYDTKFAVIDNFLVFKFWAGEQLAYMMPVGTGDLKAVLRELIEDAGQENQPFCMLGVCSNMRAELEAILPGQFTFTEDRDYADYIYLRSDLSTLKGKSSRRKEIISTGFVIHTRIMNIHRLLPTASRNAWI